MSVWMLQDHPPIDAPAWARLVGVANGRWRVADARGRILGHLRAVKFDDAWRFSAERLTATGGFRRLGEFWASRDAFDCLRYAG